MKRVMIGMSGGVDSTVTVALLQEQGYQCCGVTLRLRDGAEGDIADAAGAAAQLGIPHEAPDFRKEFRERVMDRFASVYEAGGTPNPCIDCNRTIKFGLFLDYALSRGYDGIATGHYVTTGFDSGTGRYVMRKGLDTEKDQSYVLYMLPQESLARILFPLGGLRKAEVRQKAASLGLATASRSDSQDICFVPDGDYVAFLERHTGRTYPAGNFVDASGRVLGRHRGAVRYTIGQRRGLDLPMGERVYVCGKDMGRNEVVVGSPDDLMSRGLIASDVSWLSVGEPKGPIRALVRTRYHQKETPCTVTPLPGGRAEVRFDAPMRAVTMGQAAVFYDGDLVLGGGTIERALT